MNEISRCCRLLGVKGGMSLDEVKKVYRDLVQVWHPDRFQGNDRLAAKAQEQLKEINLAYDFLLANAFQDGVLVEPPDDAVAVAPTVVSQTPDAPTTESTGSETEAREPAGSRNTLWAVCGVVIVLAGCGILWYFRAHYASPKAISTQSNVSASAPSSQSNNQPNTPAELLTKPPARPAPQSASLFPFSRDVGSTFSATNGPKCLEAPYLLSPPFSIRAKVALTNLPEIILSYGLGRVIFNWSDHPDQLRVHDPRNWNVTPVSDQGMLLPNGPHELVWTILTDSMSVSVDGQVRFQTKANYEKVKGHPGFNPASAREILQSFVLETPAALRLTEPAARDHAPVANDILSSLVPDKSAQVATHPDGVVVWSAGDSDTRLMSSQTFQPPFVIRTRAKTDALNLRLYCGNGEVIFNWERDLHELRVHDPLNGAQVGIHDQGLVSANEWHAIIWEVQTTGMNVFVDGRLRFQKRNDYRKLNARVGIGPAQLRRTQTLFFPFLNCPARRNCLASVDVPPV
jgi:hypothetical protein